MKIRNILLLLLLLGLAGCQSFQGSRGGGEKIATVVNQTHFTLEVQRQGDYVATLGRGDTYHLEADKDSKTAGGAVTLVVLAYEEQGGYVGTAHRVFRPRSFVVWEITSAQLNRPEDADTGRK